MRRVAAVSVTLAGLVAVSALFSGSVLARPAAKAFPLGCWKGKGTFKGSYKKGALNARVTNGKLKFALGVGKNGTLGTMDTSGHGSGTLTLSGADIGMEVNMTGDYSLFGPPSAIKVNGSERWKGVAIYNGSSFPVNLKFPLHDFPMTITAVSASKVSGLFGKSPWTAVRIGKLVSLESCYKKAGF